MPGGSFFSEILITRNSVSNVKSTVKFGMYKLQSEFHIKTLNVHNLLPALFEIIDMQPFEF